MQKALNNEPSLVRREKMEKRDRTDLRTGAGSTSYPEGES